MPTMDTIRIQVRHANPLIAAGLATTLHAHGDIATGDGDQADVLVTDYETGLALLASARAEPGFRHGVLPSVLIVTQRETESEIRHALGLGARGFLVLGCTVEELVSAVRALRAGARYVGARAAQRLADSVAYEALTEREHAVLRLLVQGMGNKAIARDLDIAIGTVKSHLKAIFQKLNASSRTEVAAVAERRGLLALHA